MVTLSFDYYEITDKGEVLGQYKFLDGFHPRPRKPTGSHNIFPCSLTYDEELAETVCVPDVLIKLDFYSNKRVRNLCQLMNNDGSPMDIQSMEDAEKVKPYSDDMPAGYDVQTYIERTMSLMTTYRNSMSDLFEIALPVAETLYEDFHDALYALYEGDTITVAHSNFYYESISTFTKAIGNVRKGNLSGVKQYEYMEPPTGYYKAFGNLAAINDEGEIVVMTKASGYTVHNASASHAKTRAVRAYNYMTGETIHIPVYLIILSSLNGGIPLNTKMRLKVENVFINGDYNDFRRDNVAYKGVSDLSQLDEDDRIFAVHTTYPHHDKLMLKFRTGIDEIKDSSSVRAVQKEFSNAQTILSQTPDEILDMVCYDDRYRKIVQSLIQASSIKKFETLTGFSYEQYRAVIYRILKLINRISKT